jgi:hypothetical protein
VDVEKPAVRFRIVPDEKDAPWFILETRGENQTAEEAEVLLDALERAIYAHERYVTVIDLTDLPTWSTVTACLPLIREWLLRNQAMCEERAASTAVVIKESFWSPVAKKIVDGFITLVPPVCPFLLTHSRELAEVFLSNNRSDRHLSSASTTASDDDGRSPEPMWSAMRRSSTTASFVSCIEIEDSQSPLTPLAKSRSNVFFSTEELHDEKPRTCTFTSWMRCCIAR